MPLCSEDFQSRREREDHMADRSIHHYCPYCSQEFSDDDELDEHNEDNHERCLVCDSWFRDKDTQEDHAKEEHNKCAECDRVFVSQINLFQHMRSTRHTRKDVPCHGCGSRFVSKGALFLHLETGMCELRVTRPEIDRWVARRDSNNLITIPNRSTSNRRRIATEASRDGSRYKCRLCDKTFQSLAHLNQHLVSPVHDQAPYRCPKHSRSCGAQFKTLSAFCQHLESGSCEVAESRAIRDLMSALVRGVEDIPPQ